MRHANDGCLRFYYFRSHCPVHGRDTGHIQALRFFFLFSGFRLLPRSRSCGDPSLTLCRASDFTVRFRGFDHRCKRGAEVSDFEAFGYSALTAASIFFGDKPSGNSRTIVAFSNCCSFPSPQPFSPQRNPARGYANNTGNKLIYQSAILSAVFLASVQSSGFPWFNWNTSMHYTRWVQLMTTVAIIAVVGAILLRPVYSPGWRDSFLKTDWMVKHQAIKRACPLAASKICHLIVLPCGFGTCRVRK